jgi:peptidoglycan/LPS O-acetylase OafA/YrhL
MTLDSRQNEPDSAPEPIGADFIIPLLACMLAIYYLTTTTDLVWEARAAGVVIGVPLIVLCVVHMTRMGLRIASRRATLGTGALFENNLFNRQRLGLAVLAALFVATIQWTGTTLGLLLFLIGSMLILGVRSIRIIAGISIITAALVYALLIVLLSSRLPQGPIEKLLAPLVGGS